MSQREEKESTVDEIMQDSDAQTTYGLIWLLLMHILRYSTSNSDVLWNPSKEKST